MASHCLPVEVIPRFVAPMEIVLVREWALQPVNSVHVTPGILESSATLLSTIAPMNLASITGIANL